jgi:hypothetical protein
LDRRLGEPQSQSERCGGEKNPSLLGIDPDPSRPYVSITVLTYYFDVRLHNTVSRSRTD